MKTFFNLDKLTMDPCVSFGMADGDLIDLDAAEKQEVRTPQALIDASAMAGELSELAATAVALGCRQGIRVLRVDGNKVSPGSIEPGFFECLQDRAFHICLPADPMPHNMRPVPPLAEQFALCATELLVPTQPPVCQLIGYMAAIRDAALSHELPSALVGHDAEAWSFGSLSDFDDSLQFAKLVMNSCPSFKHTHGYVNHLFHWLESREIERLTFNQVMEAVKQDDPFAPWRQLGVPRPGTRRPHEAVRIKPGVRARRTASGRHRLDLCEPRGRAAQQRDASVRTGRRQNAPSALQAPIRSD